MTSQRKITLTGGGGTRTPLLIHGLAATSSTLGIHELARYDIEAELGREVIWRVSLSRRSSRQNLRVEI